MPYQCAKAVCATFCYHIAGALIPLFGPDFPSQCIPPEAPEHGRMIIDPAIIIQSTREADHLRRLYSNTVTSAANKSPKRDRKIFRSVYDDGRHHPRHRIRRHFINRDSPYSTDTDGEIPAKVDRSIPNHAHHDSILPIAPHRTSHGWTPANVTSHHQDVLAPSPWLSSVPRFTSTQSYPEHHDLQPQPHSLPTAHSPPPSYPRHYHHHHHNHRAQHEHLPRSHHYLRQHTRFTEHINTDYDYDGGESRTTTGPSTAATSPVNEKNSESSLGQEKNAALLLMNLSVRDTKLRRTGREGVGVISETTSPVDQAFPRVKRRRATSM